MKELENIWKTWNEPKRTAQNRGTKRNKYARKYM